MSSNLLKVKSAEILINVTAPLKSPAQAACDNCSPVNFFWLIVTCNSIAANPACTGYAQLSTADRHVSSRNISIALCDFSIVTKWYRFTGSAGTSMPESCPAEFQCTTHAPGWLNGIHPTVAEGEVTRTVCYHYSGSCCYWSSTIKVLNCGGFYVYELKPTTGCSLRYCGTNVGECSS